MTESILHKMLVEKIKQWILGVSKEEMLIFCDLENKSLGNDMPPKVESYIPDVYAIGKISNNVIIGEAKTSQWDLESEHSEWQIKAFLKHCSEKKNSMVVLAVHPELINCAKSLLSSSKRKNNLQLVETQVINLFLLI